MAGCLAEALAAADQHPFLRVKACLDALRANAQWTDDEVMEVQINVIRELINRLPREELSGPRSTGRGPGHGGQK